MDKFFTHVIRTLTERVEKIQAILLHGSQNSPQVVDMWSDHDIWIVLNPSAYINEPQLVQAVTNIGVVLGSELHKKDEQLLYRTAVLWESSIRLLDITLSHKEPTSDPLDRQTIVFGHLEPPSVTPRSPITNTTFDPDETRISPTWFKYIVAINKFCRNDNLIGMHLLLDLIREYLVLEMVERDHRKKTNIHRHGDHEFLPEQIRLSRIKESTTQVLDYIADLAYAYDKKLASMDEDYFSRFPWILEYIKRSRAHVLR